jgi:ribonuclease BN (tRNA processing enzyme)
MNALLYVCNNFKNQRVPALCLIIKDQKYMINFPELTQRFLKENGIKIAPNSRFFVTGTSPDHYMGLPGLMLTTIERKSNDDNKIYYPLKTFEFMNNFKYQIGLKFLAYSHYGVGTGGVDKKTIGVNSNTFGMFFSMENSNFHNFFNWDEVTQALRKEVMGQLNDPSRNIMPTSKYISDEIVKTCGLRIMKEDYTEVVIAPITNESGSQTFLALLFIVNNNERKFKTDLLKQLKIPPATMGLLVKQGYADLPSGQRVTMEELTYPQHPYGVLVLDIPDDQFLSTLKAIPFLKWVTEEGQKIFDLKFIFHCASADVVFKPQYIEWLESAPVSPVHHMFLHISFDEEFSHRHDHCHFLRYRANYERLNRFFPFFYPKLPFALFNNLETLGKIKCKKTIFRSFSRVEVKKEVLEPIGFDESNKQVIEQMKAILDMSHDPLYDQFKHIISAKNEFKAFPFFITLGTGSMVPSTYRNVSSVMFGVNENCIGLFDCGEGTYHQINEQFGDLVDEILIKTRIILITHIHGDHMYGILNLIHKRAKALAERRQPHEQTPLFLCIPANCLQIPLSFIEEIGSELNLNFVVITNQDIARTERPDDKYLNNSCDAPDDEDEGVFLNYHNTTYEKQVQMNEQLFPNRMTLFKQFCLENDITSILPVPVIHCPESVGFVVDFKGKRVVYSGDCRMTVQLAQYGQNADLLIHEATFDCSQDVETVMRKNHSNIEHALKIAILMNSKHTCLTHFSQRYHLDPTDKGKDEIVLPKSDFLVDYFYKNSFLAQDHLYFDFDTLPILSKINSLINYNYVFKQATIDDPLTNVHFQN